MVAPRCGTGPARSFWARKAGCRGPASSGMRAVRESAEALPLSGRVCPRRLAGNGNAIGLHEKSGGQDRAGKEQGRKSPTASSGRKDSKPGRNAECEDAMMKRDGVRMARGSAMEG